MSGSYPPLDPEDQNRRVDDFDEVNRITNFDLYKMIQNLDRNLAEHASNTAAHIKTQAEMQPKIQELITILDRGKFLTAIILGFSVLAGVIWGFIEWAGKHIKI